MSRINFEEIYQKFKSITGNRSVGRYFLVMLFVKYISDCWKEAYEQYKLKYGADEELIQRKMRRERFIVSERTSFDYIVSQKGDAFLGDIINRVLYEIEDLNRDRLDGLFGHVDFNDEYALGETRERIHFLNELINCFEEIDLRPSNSKQMDFIEECIRFIGNFTEIMSSRGGEFFTPVDICKLVAYLVEPKPGNGIYDPLCGSGGLLIAAAQEVKDVDRSPSNNYALYGQEISKEIRAWAVMNMYLFGVDNARIAGGDVITNPVWIKDDALMTFDIVVAHLPFSSDVWGMEKMENDQYGRFKWGVPSRTKGEYAFIQHIIASMDSNGRAGLVIPHGVLFREGKELSIRKGILEGNLIEAIIALPSNLFMYTSIPCAIMILNKAKGKNKNLLFIDASNDFDPGKYRNKLQAEHIQKIVSTYQQFRKDPSANGSAIMERYSWVATSEQIAAANYNLNVSRYVDSSEEDDEKLDIPALQREIALLEKELVLLKSNIRERAKELGFGNLSS